MFTDFVLDCNWCNMAGVGVVFKQEPGCTSEDEATPTSKIGHNVPSESPVSLVDLEERILQLCAESPRGITDEVIMKDQPLLDTGIRLKALQRLLSQVCICVCMCVEEKELNSRGHSVT